MLTEGDFSIKKGPFEPSFASLQQFKCPEWFKDAKFGIWAHWGPQSVPMYGDWYARHIYEEGSPQYLYHIRKYGHPSEFGYKDICKLWKAENFDPAALMDLYVKAGAKYFMSIAMHHDNFDNWDSAYQPRFNSVAMGPKRNILMEWKEQAKKHGLPFCVSEHLSASFSWFAPAKGCDKEGKYKNVPYDGNDPEYADLYFSGNNGYRLGYDRNYDRSGWYSQNKGFHKHWFLRIKDLIDKVKPDMIYCDGALPFLIYENGEIHRSLVYNRPIADKDVGFALDIIAHLYNTSHEEHGQNRAIFTQKQKNEFVFSTGILDIERSQEERITPFHWQTDTSVGDWFYNVRDRYKPWNVIVESLVDITSKNGCLMLCVNLRPDGTLDYECEYILHRIAGWMEANGEGIFGTRPYRISGEGRAGFSATGDLKESAVNWQPGDVRYTQKDSEIFAYLMRRPYDNKVVMRELNNNRETVKQVYMLGGGELAFEQNGSALIVDLPDKLPNEYVNGIRILIQ